MISLPLDFPSMMAVGDIRIWQYATELGFENAEHWMNNCLLRSYLVYKPVLDAFTNIKLFNLYDIVKLG